MSEVPQLKIGIVGCGNMAHVHARLLKKYLPVDHIALCDLDKVRLESFAEDFGLKHTYQDVDQMIDTFKPDVIHVVTPPKIHTKIAVHCLNKKCHVLIEKPMCITQEEADEIQEAAKKNDRLVCVDHMRSYEPITLKAKAILEKGQVGEIININIGYSYDYLKRIDTDPAARWLNKLPGGSFFDLMPHLLCLLNDYMPGLKLEHSQYKRNEKDVVTDVQCLFTAKNKTAQLHMSLHTYPLKNYIEFECTNGVVRVDYRNFLLTVRKNYGLPNAIERIVENLSLGFQMVFGSVASVFKYLFGKLDPYGGLDNIIQEFYVAIEQGKKSPVDVDEAKKVLKLTTDIFHHWKEPIDEEINNEYKESDVLVTGGTGFIGRKLVNRLIKEGKKVRVLTHRNISAKEQAQLFEGEVNLVRGNIYSFKDVSDACQGVDVVYHLAAAMQGNRNYHLDTTITGTQNILKAIKDNNVKHLVYTSSLTVYDLENYRDNNMIDEKAKLEKTPEKRGSYSYAKLKAEKIVRDFVKQNKIAVTILRPGRVFGPGVGAFTPDIGRRMGSKLVVIMGIGSRKLPLVYVDNLIDAFILSLANSSEKKVHTYNIVDSEYPTQREYLKIYKKRTGEKLFVVYLPFILLYPGFWVLEKTFKLLFKKSVSLVYKLRAVSTNPFFSTKKINKDLGWKQNVSFKDALESSV